MPNIDIECSYDGCVCYDCAYDEACGCCIECEYDGYCTPDYGDCDEKETK